jgi:hypothetical protein
MQLADIGVEEHEDTSEDGLPSYEYHEGHDAK